MPRTGAVLAEWEDEAPAGPGGYVLDSTVIRRRFGLGPFAGQLFIHAMGVAGHDVVKYALDTYATDNGPSLSCTHDANAWPSDRFAGLPAPRADERVILWVQNSHAVPIPAGAMALDRMGEEAPVAIDVEIAPFASHPLDVADYFPGLHWPAQIELRAGRHVVRPRYEVVRGGRTRIAHINVERGDLKDDPGIKALHAVDGARFPAAVPGAAADPLQDHRAADADGDLGAEPAAAIGRVRRRRHEAAAAFPRPAAAPARSGAGSG